MDWVLGYVNMLSLGNEEKALKDIGGGGNRLFPKKERLRAGGEGDDRGWDDWMASSTQWTWVRVDSGSWWWTGRPGMLQFMGSQRVRRLSNWTELMGPDAVILVFWMLNFKPTSSLSSFTLIKSLFSFSSLCPKGGVICVCEITDISPGNLDSSLCFIQPRISHDVLCI